MIIKIKNKILVFFLVIIVILAMPFVLGISDDSSVIIEIREGVICSNPDGEHWINSATTPSTLYPTTGPLGDCFEPDALGPQGYTCCPRGQICNAEDKCELSTVNYCRDLDSTDCPNYPEWLAENSVEGLQGDDEFCGIDGDSLYDSGGSNWCWNERVCGCVWDGVCKPAYEVIEDCSGAETPQGTCTYNEGTWNDKCQEDGFIYASWSSDWTGSGARPDTCPVETGIRAIPCESVIKLSFFSLINVIITIFVLAFVYFCIGLKNKTSFLEKTLTKKENKDLLEKFKQKIK